MARDRLAALRAQRQQEGGSPQAHEMSNLYTPDQIATPTYRTNGGDGAGVSGPSGDPMGDFYNEISSIQESIQTFNANVTRISELHQRSLSSTDEAYNRHNNAMLEDLITQTRDLGNQIKGRIQALESQPVQPGEDVRMRKNRISFLRTKFLESLQSYQTVERDYRQKYKQRVERQFLIVKPDASPEEISAVVNDTEGGGDQVFAQALTSTTRYGESRAAYREVQDRHEELRRIERTLEELAQLFSDVSVLVAEQDDAINAIDTTAARVEADTAGGLDQTEKAVKSARAARRKRWICFWVFLIFLAVVAIVVGVAVSQAVKK